MANKKTEITADLFDIASDDSPVVDGVALDPAVRNEYLVLLIIYVRKNFNHIGFILVQVIGTSTNISYSIINSLNHYVIRLAQRKNFPN